MLALANPAAAQDRTESIHLFGGDLGTAQTIAKIRQLVDRGIKSIQINRQAIAIAWPTPQFSETEKAQAIFNWVAQNTRFIPDIVGKETLRTADEILRVRAGDCDDLNAILIPSLLGTIGIRSRVVTIAHDPDDPAEFSHIYAEAFVDGQWVPMDVARPGAAFGRAPENYFRMRVWDLFSPAYYDLKSLSGYLSRGRLGRGRLGLGQDGGSSFDWSQFESEIPSIISSTTGLVAAARANPSNIVASGVGAGTVAPAAAVPITTQLGISSGTLLLLGGLLVVLLVAKR